MHAPDVRDVKQHHGQALQAQTKGPRLVAWWQQQQRQQQQESKAGLSQYSPIGQCELHVGTPMQQTQPSTLTAGLWGCRMQTQASDVEHACGLNSTDVASTAHM
jgi:hypothetical protein